VLDATSCNLSNIEEIRKLFPRMAPKTVTEVILAVLEDEDEQERNLDNPLEVEQQIRDEDVAPVTVPKRSRRGNIVSPIPSRCRIQETRKQILAISKTLFAHTIGPSFFDINVKDVLTLMISRMGLQDLTRENNTKINIASSWDGTNLGNMAFFMWGLKLVDTRSTDFHTGRPSVLGETVQSRNNCLPCGISFKKDSAENVQIYMAKFTRGY
jgi:hypothetical protein